MSHTSYFYKNDDSNNNDSNNDSATHQVDSTQNVPVPKDVTVSNKFIPNQKKRDRLDKYYSVWYKEKFFVDDGFGGKEKEIIDFCSRDNEEMIKTIKDKNKKYYLSKKPHSNNPEDFPILNFELKLINFVNDHIFELDDCDFNSQNLLKENLIYYWREFQKKDFHLALNDPTIKNSDLSENWFEENFYRSSTESIFRNTPVPLEHIEILFSKRFLCVSVFLGLKAHLDRQMFYHLVTVRNLTINGIVYEIGLIYYETIYYHQYRLDVLLPRSLEIYSKSELKKHLEVFCRQQSVFTEKCLNYSSFYSTVSARFSSLKHPKYKGLDEHEYYLGIPLKDEKEDSD